MNAQELRVEYQMSNGMWMTAAGEQIEAMLARCERYNGIDAEGKIVPAHLSVRTLTRDEVVQALSDGKSLRNRDEDWYSNCRSGAVHDAAVARIKASRKPVEMVRCACGHEVPRSQVMSASMGTSCPDCYDRMSDA